MFLSWIEKELSFYSNSSNDDFLSLYIICKHFHESYLFFYCWCNYVISIYGGTILYRWSESRLWSGRSGNRIILGKGTRRKVQGIKTGGKGLSQSQGGLATERWEAKGFSSWDAEWWGAEWLSENWTSSQGTSGRGPRIQKNSKRLMRVAAIMFLFLIRLRFPESKSYLLLLIFVLVVSLQKL